MTEGASNEQDSTLLAPDGSTTTPVIVEQCSFDGDLYHGTNEAAAEGAVVVAGLGSGVLSTIDACVKAREATVKFKDNIEAITAFLGPLVEAKVLSASEARLGLASPKLSRLCKIGEYAERLRHEQILRYFLDTGRSGHTLIYQVAVLLDQTPDDKGEEARVQHLVDTLRSGQVETRQDMLRLTRDLKQAKRELNADDTGSNLDGPTHEDPAGEVGRRYDLVLAAPRPSDLRKLNEYYMDSADQPDQLPRCLVDEDLLDDAVLVVVTELSDLPVIKDKLFPRCGFADIPFRVLLTESPRDPDVTHAQVVIVAERGSASRVRSSELAWPPHNEKRSDPVTLADRLAPQAKSKLNLFESKKADGWFSLSNGTRREHADE